MGMPAIRSRVVESALADRGTDYQIAIYPPKKSQRIVSKMCQLSAAAKFRSCRQPSLASRQIFFKWTSPWCLLSEIGLQAQIFVSPKTNFRKNNRPYPEAVYTTHKRIACGRNSDTTSVRKDFLHPFFSCNRKYEQRSPITFIMRCRQFQWATIYCVIYGRYLYFCKRFIDEKASHGEIQTIHTPLIDSENQDMLQNRLIELFELVYDSL